MRILKWPVEQPRGLLVAVLMLVLAGGVVLATHFTGFEVDFNIVFDAIGDQDWENALNSTTPDPTQIAANDNPPSAVDNPGKPGTAVLLFDPLASGGLSDNSTFTGGSTAKETAPSVPGPPIEGGVTDWSIATGNVPGKDDISLVYLWIDDAANNLVIGLERIDTGGDAHVDFSVDHLPWETCPNDPNSKCPVRTAGDLLLAFDISGGGDINTHLFVWDINGDGVDQRSLTPFNVTGGTFGCDGQITGTGNLAKSCVDGKKGLNRYGWEEVPIPPNDIEHDLNKDSPIDAGPWGSFDSAGKPRTTIPINGFFEAYVNLKDLGFTPRCPGTATVSVRTRSSESIDAALMDLAGPVDLGKSSIAVIATLTPVPCELSIDFEGSATVPGADPITDPDLYHWDFYKCVGSCDLTNPVIDDTLVGSVDDTVASPPPFDVTAEGKYYAVLTVTQPIEECVGSAVSDAVQVNAPLSAVAATLNTIVEKCDYPCTNTSNQNQTGDGVSLIPTLSGGSGHYLLKWTTIPSGFDTCPDQVVVPPDTHGLGCQLDVPDSFHCGLFLVKLAVSDNGPGATCAEKSFDLGFVRKQTIIKFAPGAQPVGLQNVNVSCQDAPNGTCVQTP